MNYNYIETEIINKVINITLNRPEVHNAINAIMIKELLSVFSEIEKDDELRLVIIRGKGKSFSSGADLNYMKEQALMSPQENLNDAKLLAQLFFAVYSCTLPVITIAHGNVAGGANGLVAASDYAISDDDTIFRFSEVRLGLVPATIAPYVVERIGSSKASELLLSGRPFSGFEAEKCNLVNSSVPAVSIEREVKKISSEFLKAAPNASKITKSLIRNLGNQKSIEEKISFTAEIIAKARGSVEGKEGIQSFFESRKANWLNESI